MRATLIAFVRLSRPHFLPGGFLLYALGALVARYQGYPIDAGLYWVGQMFVTSMQLMTHYLNEYWDADTDARNGSRTLFSGGSGVFTEGLLKRDTALAAALVCLALGSGAAIWLVLDFAVHPGVWVLMLLIFLGAYSYSSPPFAMAGSGYGEFSASLVVAGLVPAMSHLMMAGRPSVMVLLATAPLMVLHFAMILAFEFPDFLADEAAGKRTLLVRLGRHLGAAVHNALLLAALLLGAAATFAGLPARVALSLVITAPLVLMQIINMRRMRRGEPVAYSHFTLLAVTVFALTAYLTAFNFWVLGN